MDVPEGPSQLAENGFGGGDAESALWQAAWTDLVRRFQRPLRGYFRRIRASADDIEGLIQATFTHLQDDLRAYREPECVTWEMVQVHARKAGRDYVDYMRRLVFACDLGAVEGPEPASEVDAIHQGQLEDWALALLSELPYREREAFILRRMRGMNTVETASVMGCSSGNVKSLYHKGLARLRALSQRHRPPSQGRLE